MTKRCLTFVCLGLSMLEVVLGACYSNLCENGGTCTAIGDSRYKCQCPTRFYGRNCQSVSTCTPRTLTTKNGRCCVFPFKYEGRFYDNCAYHKGFINYFWCSFDAVYTGNWAPCVNHCTSWPCTQRGTICDITGFDKYTCVSSNCIGRYNPCQNGGTCSQVGYHDYSCRCTLGFDGKRCQNAVIGGQEVSSTLVAILIGSAVLVVLTCIICILCRRRKRTRQTRQQPEVSARVHVPSLQVTLDHPSLPPQSDGETPRQLVYALPSQTGNGVPPPPYSLQVLENIPPQEAPGGASSFPIPLTKDVTSYTSAPPGDDSPLPSVAPGDDSPYSSAPPGVDSPLSSVAPADDSLLPSVAPGDDSPYSSAAPGDDSSLPSVAPGEDSPYSSAPPGDDSPLPSAALGVDSPYSSAPPGDDSPLPSVAPGGDSPYSSAPPEDDSPLPSVAPGVDSPHSSAPPGDDSSLPSVAPGEDSPYSSAPPGEDSPYPSAPSADNSPFPSTPSGSDPPYPSAPPGITPSYPPKSAGGLPPK